MQVAIGKGAHGYARRVRIEQRPAEQEADHDEHGVYREQYPKHLFLVGFMIIPSQFHLHKAIHKIVVEDEEEQQHGHRGQHARGQEFGLARVHHLVYVQGERIQGCVFQKSSGCSIMFQHFAAHSTPHTARAGLLSGRMMRR